MSEIKLPSEVQPGDYILMSDDRMLVYARDGVWHEVVGHLAPTVEVVLRDTPDRTKARVILTDDPDVEIAPGRYRLMRLGVTDA